MPCGIGTQLRAKTYEMSRHWVGFHGWASAAQGTAIEPEGETDGIPGQFVPDKIQADGKPFKTD